MARSLRRHSAVTCRFVKKIVFPFAYIWRKLCLLNGRGDKLAPELPLLPRLFLKRSGEKLRKRYFRMLVSKASRIRQQLFHRKKDSTPIQNRLYKAPKISISPSAKPSICLFYLKSEPWDKHIEYAYCWGGTVHEQHFLSFSLLALHILDSNSSSPDFFSFGRWGVVNYPFDSSTKRQHSSTEW